MVFSRGVTTVILVLFITLGLFSHSVEASFLDAILQRLSAFTSRAGETATAAPVDIIPKPKREGKRVAIIGAGSAGSSSAYYLRRFLDGSSVSKLPLDITVFEKHSYVGGRSTTINAYDDPALPIELGASIFVSVNHNLVNAANDLGLKASSLSALRQKDDESDILGVYDGKKLLFTYPEGTWWSLAKLIYRYGPLAPWRTKKLTETTVAKFLAMYEAPLFPFASLSEAVEAVGLLPATGNTGVQFLESNGIGGAFAQELIQASTRVNYGSNLGLIHGLETMVCMAAEGAMSIEGGNWQIFHRMINSSNIDLRLQTPVTSISKSEDGEWIVSSKPAGAKRATREIYDSVIIAGPLQYADLAIEPELEKKPDVIPYATVHVTLFASPLRLDSTFFGLKAGQSVPQVILTTLNETERTNATILRGEGRGAVGSAGFFSISTLRTVMRPLPNDGEGKKVEYIYKVFSPERFDDNKVKMIMGIQDGNEKAALTWMYRHVWQAYPYEYPRVTFEESKLADGLWYTAGIESFISTMETSSLMGMNVAKLIVDEWAEEKMKAIAKKEAEAVAVREAEEAQKVAEKQATEKLAKEKLLQELTKEMLAEEKLTKEKLAEEKFTEEKLAGEKQAEQKLTDEEPAEQASKKQAGEDAEKETEPATEKKPEETMETAAELVKDAESVIEPVTTESVQVVMGSVETIAAVEETGVAEEEEPIAVEGSTKDIPVVAGEL